MKIRQRAVALYFIDKLALRAGNEKDEDQADTVGCCSLRVEHIKLHEEHEGKNRIRVLYSPWGLSLNAIQVELSINCCVNSLQIVNHWIPRGALTRFYCIRDQKSLYFYN